MNRANSRRTHVGLHRSGSREPRLPVREKIQKGFPRGNRPPGTGDPYPCKVRSELVGLNSTASDTLHYRAPIVWDWSFLAAYGVHHRAVDPELSRHSGAAPHQIACRQKEIDGF